MYYVFFNVVVNTYHVIILSRGDGFLSIKNPGGNAYIVTDVIVFAEHKGIILTYYLVLHDVSFRVRYTHNTHDNTCFLLGIFIHAM